MFYCCSCVFLSFFSFSSINKLEVWYAIANFLCFTHVATTYMCFIFFLNHYFWQFSHYTSLPFLCSTTMESTTPKTNAKPNLMPFCVVGRLARCSSNNIVNSSKQEAPFEVDINDLIIQEALLDHLKKQAKFWRSH